jgi:very-short-patch-repair endonuclease
MRPVDGRVHQLASKQRYLVTRSQVLTLGGSDAGISRRVSSGQWQLVQPGVYQVDQRPPEWEDMVLSAVLAAGDGAVASHRAALVLWDLDGISSAPIEITAPYTHSPVPSGTIVHRTRRPAEATSMAGVPVTTIERTLLDISAVLWPLAVTKAFESAFRRRLTTVDRMFAFLKERGGRGVKGTRMARRILNNRRDDTSTDSGAETEALYLMRRAGLPEPILQYRITTLDGETFRLDFYWALLRKAIEIDGLNAHDSADKLDNDLQRQNKLMDLGIELRRFSARRIRQHPDEFIAEVRRFLDA